MRVCRYVFAGFCLMAFSLKAKEPKMYYTDTSSGKPIAKDPTIIYFNRMYRMYYSIPGQEGSGWRIGMATSDDLEHWQKQGEVTGVTSYERNGICAPDAFVRKDTLHLFYQTYGNGADDAICHAISIDGLRFTRDSSNPVFHPNGSWNNGRAIDAELVFFKGRYYLYFATRDPSGEIQQLGVAETSGNSTFSRSEWTMAADHTIMAPTLEWEGKCVEGASIIEYGDQLYMFYAGSYNNAPQQIGVATSRDGINWNRMGDEPFLPNGTEGSWNSSESGHPDIFKDQQVNYHLFFQGNNTQGNSWYLSKIPITWHGDVPVAD